jgi:hypothetical protein
MLNYPVAYTIFVADGTRKFDFAAHGGCQLMIRLTKVSRSRKWRTPQPIANLDFVELAALAEVFARFQLA